VADTVLSKEKPSGLFPSPGLAARAGRPDHGRHPETPLAVGHSGVVAQRGEAGSTGLYPSLGRAASKGRR